jgi:5'-nucleotidase
MPYSFDGKLVIAISSRALFDLDEANRVYEQQGLEAYCRYMIEHENDVLGEGVAFTMVKKLLALNDDDPSHTKVEVILLSRNSADSGLRIFNSIEHYGLSITRAAFTNGQRPFTYVPAFEAHLFLSANQEDVRLALEAGYAAATILPSNRGVNPSGQLRIAFDGDAVVFSDEAEQIYQRHGLEAFSRAETQAALTPLSGGPFMGFLTALHRIQSQYPPERAPIRTALVTARGAPAHKRVILTLRKWGVRIDEAFFLGGLDKGQFLKAFGADIFFDDQRVHCDSASRHVGTAHVPHGVSNAVSGDGASGSEAATEVLSRPVRVGMA